MARAVAQVHERLLAELDLRRTDIGKLDAAQLRASVRRAADDIVARGGWGPGTDVDLLASRATDEAVGFGPLERLLDDDSVSEIMVNGPNCIFVESGGALRPVDLAFSCEAALRGVIERMLATCARRVDESSPMADTRLPDGSRVNVILPPPAVRGPYVTVRKFSRQRLDLPALVAAHSLSQQMADFLVLAVRARRNIVISGGTGSGKTTLLNAISQFIGSDERVVTIEDAAELQLLHEHVLSLEARPSNLEGRGEISIRDLVRNALRMRPDRIIVGECRGGEALDMLQAMNTGHAGSLTSAHANSPRDLLARLEVMVLMSGMDLPLSAIRAQVAGAVDLIVQQCRFADGRRRITSIVEVVGLEGGVILLQELFCFRRRGESGAADGQGRFDGCGHWPQFAEQLPPALQPSPDLFARAADDLEVL